MINAPSSTKNADKARDPEMHQTKKGNQWYFDGLRVHPLCAKSEHKILDIGRKDATHDASSSRKRIQRGRFEKAYISVVTDTIVQSIGRQGLKLPLAHAAKPGRFEKLL